MRLMGLDIGEKRIGIAYANFLDHPGFGALAAPSVELTWWGLNPPLIVPGGILVVKDRESSIRDLKDLIEEESVEVIVIGLPLQDGLETRQAQKIKKYAEGLIEKLPNHKFFFWDEALTSFSASFLLRDADLKHSGQKKKGRVDSVAATIILKSFCEHWQSKMPQ
jgi:putative Holliday junction resolvase